MTNRWAALLVMLLGTVVAADVPGSWTLDLDPNFGGMPQSVECAFEQDGVKLTGDCAGVPIAGEVNGPRVTFQVKVGRSNEFTATFAGDLDQDGTTIRGMWHLADTLGEREGKFTLSKHE